VTAVDATSFPIFAAAADAEKRPAVVSIHDVAPSTRAASERILDELGRSGVRVCSLLVVPNYHRTGAAMRDAGFVRWLRDLEADGHEVVIHGYFHQRPRRAGESWRERFVTRCYTSDEGEFYDLGYRDAFERISRAREEFAAAGLTPRGFIAPAWLLGPQGERAAADAEMEYTTRLTNVRDLRSGEEFAARSLVYSVRSGWRRAVSLGWNAALARALAAAPLLRLAVHPPDLEHAEIWRQIERLAGSISDNRIVTTYRDWVGDQRIAANSAS
jgi:predicted deacetylase